jgi:hypothetical protein
MDRFSRGSRSVIVFENFNTDLSETFVKRLLSNALIKCIFNTLPGALTSFFTFFTVPSCCETVSFTFGTVPPCLLRGATMLRNRFFFYGHHVTKPFFPRSLHGATMLVWRYRFSHRVVPSDNGAAACPGPVAVNAAFKRPHLG